MTKTYQYAAELLEISSTIVGTDRQADYGDAYDNFGSISEFWTTYLRARGLLVEGAALVRSDVAMLMDLLKTSRHATGGYREDTFIDKVGYTALGGAMARVGMGEASPEPKPEPEPMTLRTVDEEIEARIAEARASIDRQQRREGKPVFTSPGYRAPSMTEPKG